MEIPGGLRRDRDCAIFGRSCPKMGVGWIGREVLVTVKVRGGSKHPEDNKVTLRWGDKGSKYPQTVKET